jgi:hypothetical protein
MKGFQEKEKERKNIAATKKERNSSCHPMVFLAALQPAAVILSRK